METDSISKLQRYCIHNGLPIVYSSNSRGKKHAPTHSVAVSVCMTDGTELLATGEALKKKDAKHLAAQALWGLLQERIANAQEDRAHKEHSGDISARGLERSNASHHHVPEKINKLNPLEGRVDGQEDCSHYEPTPGAAECESGGGFENYVGELQVRLTYLQTCTRRIFHVN